MKGFLKFFVNTLIGRMVLLFSIVFVTYILGAHRIVPWTVISIFYGSCYVLFYCYHKWWKKDWDVKRSKVLKLFTVLAFIPFTGILFTIGTAFYYGPQEVFVIDVNDISTKGMDAKVLHPYGRGSGWAHPDLPEGLKVVSSTEVQFIKDDGTVARMLISDMFPNAETSRLINNQSYFWWKIDSSNVSEELSEQQTKALPATVFMYGTYIPMPTFVKNVLCPRFTVAADGKEVPAVSNCEWAQYNIITVHDGGPYRIIYVIVTYILLLSFIVYIMRRLFLRAKKNVESFTNEAL